MADNRFSVSVHILTLLASADSELVSSQYIAGSININPAVVRKELINLRKHKFITTREGKNGGSALSKPAERILLSDIYLSVRSKDFLGKSIINGNPACKVGRQINKRLKSLYGDAERAMLLQLGKKTLKQFSAEFR